ncbi:MAG: hypothetical protein KAI83_11900 [Thiomargarita sp.]|nr:hypothetical protein [Thiomargarita sp.]
MATIKDCPYNNIRNVGWVGMKWKPTIFQRNGATSFVPTLPLNFDKIL